MAIKFLKSIAILSLMTSGREALQFDHEHQAYWYDNYKQCSLKKQSPIELATDSSKVAYDMPPVRYRYYDTPYASTATIQNIGYTVNINMPKPEGYIAELWRKFDKISPHIIGAALPASLFVVEGIHFHWGSQDGHGSEHVIDSQRYSLEMHIVHRNSKYKTLSEAGNFDDGLAVLAVMYSVKPSLLNGFVGLNTVLDALESVTEFGESANIKNFTINALINGLDTGEFFTYVGSLTTPPCSQAVTWIVFSHHIDITHSQMSCFHKLSNGHGGALVNNYRALQSKGSRTVFLRKKRNFLVNYGSKQLNNI